MKFLGRKSGSELAEEVDSIRMDTRRNSDDLRRVQNRQKDIESRLNFLQQELEVQSRKVKMRGYD